MSSKALARLIPVWFLLLWLVVPACEHVPITSEARNRLLESTKPITVIHHGPMQQLDTGGRVLLYPTIALSDPLTVVQDRFLELVRAQARSVRFDPRVSSPVGLRATQRDDLHQVKKQVGQGLVLEFRPWQWYFGVWDTEQRLNPISTSQEPRVLLGYAVRARLLDLDQEKVVWQYICRVSTERNEMDVWMADNNALIKQKTGQLAEQCAHDLASDFLR
jgi:hypothetical protein